MPKQQNPSRPEVLGVVRGADQSRYWHAYDRGEFDHRITGGQGHSHVGQGRYAAFARHAVRPALTVTRRAALGAQVGVGLVSKTFFRINSMPMINCLNLRK